MLSIIIILSIALAIFLGYRTKINTGLFCIVFAYIIGCFVMGLKPKQVIAFWPTNTMFVILSVSLFYNFAAINGTLEKMSGALLYACRNFPGLASLCTVCSSSHPFSYGSYLFSQFLHSWLRSPW